MFPPITVGDCVTAYHAESGLLLRGQVLTLETCYPEGTPSYRVQFEYPVMFTGIVRDEDLAVHGELISASTKCDGIEDTDAPDNASAAVCGEERRQWEHAATLQYFLDRKEYLLESLKVLNNLAEQELLQRTQSESSSGGIAESQFTDNFLQQHQWVIDNVVRSDHIIAQLLQQLSNDATLYGKEVISPPSPSEDNSVIQSEWILQYESLSNVSVPAPVRDQNPARLFLSGDARQASPQNLTRVEFRNSKESSTIDDYSSRKEDFSSVLELYKICVCCLALLKKFQLEEFCRPKDLCVFLVSKVDGYNDVLPMRNVVQKIEAICFGLS